jgi:hypothetical protein
MEALSGLIEKLPECEKENEIISKFIAKCQDPKLIIQQYPQDFDWSGKQDPKDVSLKDFCDRNREQGEEIVIAYVCTILGSPFPKSMLTVSPPGSQFPACISLWVQVSAVSHAMTFS